MVYIKDNGIVVNNVDLEECFIRIKIIMKDIGYLD